MISESQKQDILTRCDLRQVMENSGLHLVKSGRNYKCRCPFHNETDASFTLYEASNRYKCFGCGKSGNAIDFLMEYKGLTFYESVKQLARDCNVTLEEYNPTAEEEAKARERRQLLKVYESAAAFYQRKLAEIPKALEYARSRFDDETIELFGIGYAPDAYNDLYTHLRGAGFAFELLEKCDLFKQKKFSGCHDTFRDRLMFPIYDLTGKVVAFSGRRLSNDPDTPKYINNGDSPLYSKGRTVFGLNFAFRHIKSADCAILVEGNADVVKMHQLDIRNVVACCGTALTDDQIGLIGRASKNICLMLDGDNAGMTATIKNGKRLVEAGYNAFVLPIPKDKDGNKQDPDSFFTSKEHFEKFQKQEKRFFLSMLAAERQKTIDDPSAKTRAIREISALIQGKPDSEKELLIEELSKIIPGRTLWKKTLREVEADTREKNATKTFTSSNMSEEQDDMIRKYGFYIEKNCYYFYAVKSDNFFKGSNFIMEPLFHIESTVNAKRLYRIRNFFGAERVLEFNQKDLISIAAFRLRCESMGNFLFEGGDHGLSKIKAYLYENTKTCKEIVQLGWQKPGFFAWSNGITVDGEFKEINELGIVEFGGQYYYLPALSSFYLDEDTLFKFERKFVNIPGQTPLFEYCERMRDVYGENAVVGIGFYFATLFRDVIISSYRFFPILNIFGPKGTGKSEMAVSLLKLFGDHPVGINMTNSTIPAMADHVAHTRNALCHVDEYKNSLDYEKIEFLKGLWDGVGRSRMNMDKDKKKETTPVDAGIMLTGQEMASADNALFSRVLFLSVNKDTFTEEEKRRFTELKGIEQQGLTHITNSLLVLRKAFVESFVRRFDEVLGELTPYIDKSKVEDRILKNWTIVLTALKIVIENREIPFRYGESVKLFAKLITRQNADVEAGNEVSDFWNIYQELFSGGIIEKDFDFQVKVVSELKTTTATIDRSLKVLYMNPNRIFGLYAQTKRNANEKKLPKDTLQFYLKNSNEFIGLQQKRFRRNIKNLQEKESAKYFAGDGTDAALEYERPYAWCFNYDMLVDTMGLNLETVFYYEKKEDVKPMKEEAEQHIEPPPKPDFPEEDAQRSLFPY